MYQLTMFGTKLTTDTIDCGTRVQVPTVQRFNMRPGGAYANEVELLDTFTHPLGEYIHYTAFSDGKYIGGGSFRLFRP